eukprot:9499865-Alexandrium_andersonii.AAC.1
MRWPRASRQTFGPAGKLPATALTRPSGWPRASTRPRLGCNARPASAAGGRRTPSSGRFSKSRRTSRPSP